MKAMPTVTIGPHKNDDGSYRVECFILGLETEEQACRAADYLTALICGEEIELADAPPTRTPRRRSEGG